MLLKTLKALSVTQNAEKAKVQQQGLSSKKCGKEKDSRIRWGGLGFGRRNVWHQIDLERERERGDKELPSALLLGRKGRAWSPTPSSAAAALTRLRLSSYTQILPTAPLSFKYEDCKNYIFLASQDALEVMFVTHSLSQRSH